MEREKVQFDSGAMEGDSIRRVQNLQSSELPQIRRRLEAEVPMDYEASKSPEATAARAAGVPQDEVYYKMSGWKLAVIINMKSFSNQRERTGSEKDMRSLIETFSYLKFEIVCLEDQKREDLMNNLNIISKRDFYGCDCLVLVIMSHGGNGFLLTVDEKKFTLKEVQDRFLPNNCPHLKGKPKLFFIQACRGKEFMDYCMAADESPGNGESLVIYPIPITCDVLEFYSSEKGKLSAIQDGTWFIQSLTNRLQTHGYQEPLLNILTRVIHDVAVMKQGTLAESCQEKAEDGSDKIFKQQPVLVSKLTKLVKF